MRPDLEKTNPHSTSEPTREHEPKLVSKLHFLVHPGFLHEVNPLDHLHGGTKLLRLKYIGKAHKLPANELMVAFAPAIDDKFVRAFREKTTEAKPAFVSIITQLKEILGDRLIVLADSDEAKEVTGKHRGATFRPNQDKIWKKIKTIAEGRGFSFGDRLTGKAYGELMGACVSIVAENMHEASGMKEPISIEVDLTDYPLRLNQRELQIAEAEGKYPERNTNLNLSPRLKIDFGIQKDKP